MTEPKRSHSLQKKQLEERQFYLLSLLYFGVRLMEPLSVTPESLNFNIAKPTVTFIRKGRRKHTMTIPNHLLEEFRKRKDWPKVFIASPSGAAKAWREELAKRGIPHVSLHKFRHTKVVEMLDNGAPITRVSQFMNHSSIKVTGDIYGRYSTKPVDETFKQYDPLGIEESTHEDVNETVLDWLKHSGLRSNTHVTVAHTLDDNGRLTIQIVPKTSA